RLLDQLIHWITPQPRADSRALAVADEQLRDALGAGKIQDRADGIFAFEDLDAGARAASQFELLVERGLVGRRDIRLVHICGDQLTVQSLLNHLRRMKHILNVAERRASYQQARMRSKVQPDSVPMELSLKMMLH